MMYRAYFIDVRDGYHNQKILESPNEDAVRDYMEDLGHVVTKIESY